MPSPVRHPLARYGAALLAVGLALMVKLQLESWVGHGSPFVLFVTAVLLAAWFGGLGPGLVATGLAVLACNYYFFPPGDRFTVPTPKEAILLTLFAAEGAALSAIVAALHAARRRAEANEAAALAIDNARLDREVREALRRQAEAQGLADALFAAAPVAVAFLDADLRFVRVNETLARLNGRPVAEHLGRHVREVLGPARADRYEPYLRRVLETRRPLLGVEVRGEARGDGPPSCWLGNVYPALGPDGRVIGIGTLLADVTEARRSEEAVREGEDRLRFALEAARMVAWDWDLDANHTSRSANAAEVLGMAQGDSKDFLRLVHPDDRPGVEAALARAVRGEGDFDQEFRLRTADGRTLWVADKARLRTGPDGRSPHLVGVVADITERKRAEDALRFLAEASTGLASSLDYETTLAVVARLAVPRIADWCAIRMLEPDGTLRLLEVAHADPTRVELARELYRRYPPDPEATSGPHEVLRTGRPILHPDITDEALAAAARDEDHLRIMRSLGLRSFLCVPLVARGRTLGVISMVMAESGRTHTPDDLALAEELARRAALAVDNARLMAEARDAARRLEESVALLDTLMRTAPVGMAFVDPGLHYVHVNNALAAIDGARPEEIVGRTIREVVPSLAPSLEPLYRHVLETGEPVVNREIVGEAPSAPGEPRHWLVDYYPVRTEAGGTLGVGVVVADVTGSKRAEAELRAAMEAAESASRAKDQFLAVLSHELRTPLTPVLAAVSAMLDDPETPPEVRPTLEMTRRNVELEARLIDDLLDVTRISQGKLQIHPETVDAHALALRAVGICRGDLHAKRLRLVLELDAAEHHVEADPARLQQVFWNLIKNAIKFTPEGGTVAIRSRNERAEGRPSLVVEVADTGVGIDPEVLPRVFDAFEQGGSSITRQFGGLGLGLAISRSVIERHGGRLSAASAGRGLGATFRLDLATTPAPAPAPAGRPAPADSPPRRPLRLLFVEDNADTARVLARLLGRSGDVVTTADSVASALEHAETAEFDLVISDINLPDGSGLDLMRRLRQHRPIPGIALSGFGTEDDLRRSREAGFTTHLTKPVDFPTLEAAIRRAAANGD